MNLHDPSPEQFAERLAASGLSSRRLEEVLLVSQSTVSRLLGARIADVRRHVAAFDRHKATDVDPSDVDGVVAELAAAARRDPAVARLLTDLRNIMRNA